MQSPNHIFRNSFGTNGSVVTFQDKLSSDIDTQLKNAANEAVRLIKENPDDKFSHGDENALNVAPNKAVANTDDDCFYYFRSSFSGFVISFVDSVPSEICVLSLL